MKRFLRKCPFLSALILSGLVVIITFTVAKSDSVEWFEGRIALASAQADDKAAGAEATASQEPAVGSLPEVTGQSSFMEIILPVEEDEGQDVQTEEETGQSKGKAGHNQEETEPSAEEPGAGEEQSGDAEQDAADTEAEEHPIGVTEFVYYEPVEVHSKYYEDPGKRALTTNYPYSTVDKEYFADAAFIGDSRMVGIYDYAGFGRGDFYCDSGFCVHNWQKKGEVKWQNERREVNLMDALAQKSYKKVYLMIGMNDCGYGNSDSFRQGLQEMIAAIVERQPNAIIYLMANMYIARNKENDIFNNVDINSKNVILAECADGKRLFYLEYNELYLDEDGYLKSELTFDGVHLYGKQYAPWAEFLMSHAIVR